VKENLENAGLEIENAEIVYIPTQKTSISEKDKENYEKLFETLDNLDDVQEIYDNL
jgi:transcriptional/translational regulatory protein YebC/TACO1